MKCGAAWGLVKAHFQLPILAAHTYKHKAARPQAYKKIGGRKAASPRALEVLPGRLSKKFQDTTKQILLFIYAHGTIETPKQIGML